MIMTYTPEHKEMAEEIQRLVEAKLDTDTLGPLDKEHRQELINAIFFSGEEDPQPNIDALIHRYAAEDEHMHNNAYIFAQTAIALAEINTIELTRKEFPSFPSDSTVCEPTAE